MVFSTAFSTALTTLFRPFSGIPTQIWLLSFVSLINRAGAMVICFFTLYLTQHLQYDIRDAGYVLSCFGAGAVLGAYLGGQMTDKYGYYTVMWTTLIVNGVMLLITMYVKDFWWMCFTVFCMNIFAEGFRPANSISIKLHSDDATRTRSFSLLRVLVNFAMAIALIVGGWLIQFGWHWLFVVDGVTCFAAAAMILLGIKPRKMDILPSNNTTNLDISAYKDRTYWLFILSTFVGAVMFMQIIWTVPAFFKTIYGWNESKIGIMNAINGITVMLIEMPLIYRIEQKRPKLWFVRYGIVIYALSYSLFLCPTAWAMPIGVAYMVLISLGETFVMPFSTSWAMNYTSESRQGQYMALYTMSYSMAHIIAPLMGTQIIAAFGYSALWATTVGLGVLAYSGFWYLGKVWE